MQGSRTPCPSCSEGARCGAYRGKTLVSLRGTVHLAGPITPGAAGGQGFGPWDAGLGLAATALSPAAAEVAWVAGVQSSFAEAREKVVPKLAGLRLAESRVERTTEPRVCG